MPGRGGGRLCFRVPTGCSPCHRAPSRLPLGGPHLSSLGGVGDFGRGGADESCRRTCAVGREGLHGGQVTEVEGGSQEAMWVPQQCGLRNRRRRRFANGVP